jgi:hypothetical protein
MDKEKIKGICEAFFRADRVAALPAANENE